MQTDLNDLVVKFLEQHRITRLAVMLDDSLARVEPGPVSGDMLVCLVMDSQCRDADELYANTRTGMTIDAEPGDFQRL